MFWYTLLSEALLNLKTPSSFFSMRQSYPIPLNQLHCDETTRACVMIFNDKRAGKYLENCENRETRRKNNETFIAMYVHTFFSLSQFVVVVVVRGRVKARSYSSLAVFKLQPYDCGHAVLQVIFKLCRALPRSHYTIITPNG